MSVAAIDHVLVLSDDIDATRDFYCEVVGLRLGDRPPLEFPGYWLYADAASACLHVAERAAYLSHLSTLGLTAGQRTGGEIDHVAFDATDYASTSARIEARGITPVRNTIPGGPRQLFVDDPNGVRIEINVRDSTDTEARV
jgi:catechol 2,3-dioxygenase-like lactoylglutathione lyase family enzyme